jgi:hypothetical protein
MPFNAWKYKEKTRPKTKFYYDVMRFGDSTIYSTLIEIFWKIPTS